MSIHLSLPDIISAPKWLDIVEILALKTFTKFTRQLKFRLKLNGNSRHFVCVYDFRRVLNVVFFLLGDSPASELFIYYVLLIIYYLSLDARCT